MPNRTKQSKSLLEQACELLQGRLDAREKKTTKYVPEDDPDNSSSSEEENDQPKIDNFMDLDGDRTMLHVCNFNSQEFNQLFSIFKDTMDDIMSVRGAKIKESRKDILFLLLSTENWPELDNCS